MSNMMLRSSRKKGKKLRKSIFILLVILGILYISCFRQPVLYAEDMPNWIIQDLIYNDFEDENNMGRVKDIVIHYTANPGSTAKQNRDYFAQPQTDVNSHFIVGIDGEIIQCVPLYMKSAASNWRNNDTISIEVCHPDSSGQFTVASYNSTVKLTAWLCDQFNISRDNVIRHGDITGKNCPKFFMEHEEQWLKFKSDVKNYNGPN